MEIIKWIKKWIWMGIWIVFVLWFFSVWIFFILAYDSLSPFVWWSPLALDTMNTIVRKVNGIDYDSTWNLLELKWEVRLIDQVTDSTCDNSNSGSIVFSGWKFMWCTGTWWISFDWWSSVTNALWTINNPGLSCKNIKEETGTWLSGTYWIDPDGSGVVWAFQIYCDMETDGGWWTLIAKSDNVSSTALYNVNWVSPSLLSENTMNAHAKLSDEIINLLRWWSSWYATSYIKLYCAWNPSESQYSYFKEDKAFDSINHENRITTTYNSYSNLLLNSSCGNGDSQNWRWVTSRNSWCWSGQYGCAMYFTPSNSGFYGHNGTDVQYMDGLMWVK